MDTPQVFSFKIDAEAHKLVTVRRQGRAIEVTVRLATDVVLDSSTIEIRNAIDPQFQPDESGLTIGWKQAMIPGWDWLTFSRQRRF